VLLPLSTAHEEQRGLLMIASRKTTTGFFRTTERLYQTVGSQTALALENLRLIEQAQQAGIVTERQRLAHDIHDTLAQGFSSIVMNLEVADGMFYDDPSLVRQHMDQARSIARENLAEARRLMWALKPSSLEDASLPEALRRLTKRYSTECDAAAHATINGPPYSLSPDTELTVLRVAQEALANCRKHARAKHVWVTLSYMNNLVSLNVQDDGVGFDPHQRHTSTSDHSGGVGLNSMRQRVEQLGGTILLQSTPGKGATLMAALPVTESNEGDQRTEDAEGNPSGRRPYDGEH
jgi:signal transduction histidine kinase